MMDEIILPSLCDCPDKCNDKCIKIIAVDDAHKCEWVRTGSDTLFCFECKVSLFEPEEK